MTLAAMFFQKYNDTMNDAEAGPASLTFSEWIRHSVVEMILDLAVFVALCAGVNIDFIIKAAQTGTDTGSQANLVSIVGAVAMGTAIYKGVQLVILPIFNAFTGGTTARKKLRNKLAGVQK